MPHPIHRLGADRVLSELYYRPDALLDAIIKAGDSSIPTTASLSQSRRSLPRAPFLDALPLDIVLDIFDLLDPQFMVRISTVSSSANAMVRSHTGWAKLVTHAPHALSALRRTGLLGLHSIPDLVAVLMSSQCTYCNYFGAFFFLPTCERCCWECLYQNSSLRVLPPHCVQSLFALDEDHVRQLPHIYSIQGCYGLLFPYSIEGHTPFVSVKAARTLALEVHGSLDMLRAAALASGEGEEDRDRLHDGQYFYGRWDTRKHEDPLTVPSRLDAEIPRDPYLGVASIPLPSLSKTGETDHGQWCRGCECMSHLHRWEDLPADALVGLIPPFFNPSRVLAGFDRRAWPKSALLDHARTCRGARRFLSKKTRVQRIFNKLTTTWGPPVMTPEYQNDPDLPNGWSTDVWDSSEDDN